MTQAVKPRRVRIPVRHVDGLWECALGGAVPVESGTEAELVVDADRIADKAFLKAMDSPVKHRVLGENASFLVALTVKPEAPPRAELAPFLRWYQSMQPPLAAEFLQPFNPATLCFVAVTLSKPDKRQAKSLDSQDGGLWLITQGLRTTAIVSTTVKLPPAVSEKPAASLNHALTKLSEVYETWRLAHTGNVYSRVFYQAKNERWYPLDVLRNATIEHQEQAIAGQLWDEFIRKMTALRKGTDRK